MMFTGCSSLVFILSVSVVYIQAFVPNRFTKLSSASDDLTHQDITEIGILQAVAQFFEDVHVLGESHQAGNLTGINNITARILFDKYYGGTVSEKRFQEAIDDIVKANNRVDQDHYTEATWHVNGETIKQANDIMTSLRENVINMLNTASPNYDAARELIGQFLHIVQMFYSNTNWQELKGDAVCEELGLRGKPLMALASSTEDVCVSCGQSTEVSCRNNIILKGLLTSGYKSGQDRLKPAKDPSEHDTGKCSHGGPDDLSSGRSAAVGGINKDTSDHTLSPHYHLHHQAARAAIKHTKSFFDHHVYGMRHLLGDDVFQELFQLKTVNSVVFVIDTLTSVREDLFAVRERIKDIMEQISGTIYRPINYIIVSFRDPGTECLPADNMDIFETESMTKMNNYIKGLTVHTKHSCKGLSLSALETVVRKIKPHSKIHVFTSGSPTEPDQVKNMVNMVNEKEMSVDIHLIGDNIGQGGAVSSRHRRSAGLDLYGGLAAASGGSVYHTDKGGVAKIADIIKESATTSAATILKMSVAKTTTSKVMEIPVDDTIREVTIKIIADTTASGEPTNTLLDPNKKTIPMSTSGNVSIKDLGGGLRLIKIKFPVPGIWKLTKTDTYSWSVEVTGQSTIDFTTKFVQTNPMNGFQYEITGRPIAGEMATVIITVPSIDKIGGISRVVLTDSTGTRLDSTSLTHGRGRAASIFKGSFTLPKKAFQVSVEGTDKSGNMLQRLQPTKIFTIAVKLTIGALTGTLYINENLNIPFTVTNTGDSKTTIEVDIKDDKGFAVKPTHKSFSLEGGASSTGHFTLHAGGIEGITTTVTVSAQPTGVSGHSPQFDTRRITAEKHIIRIVDSTTPECNVTSVIGSCSLTQMDPCTCHDYTWSGTAQFGDVGKGLFQVSATVDDKDAFSYDNFSIGHTIDKGVKKATIRGDCCQPVSYINVVDLDGNTGQCNFDLAKGLTKPMYPCRHDTTTVPGTTVRAQPAIEDGLSTGAIVGIAMGAVVLVAGTVTTAVLLGQKFLCVSSAVKDVTNSLPPANSRLP